MVGLLLVTRVYGRCIASFFELAGFCLRVGRPFLLTSAKQVPDGPGRHR